MPFSLTALSQVLAALSLYAAPAFPQAAPDVTPDVVAVAPAGPAVTDAAAKDPSRASQPAQAPSAPVMLTPAEEPVAPPQVAFAELSDEQVFDRAMTSIEGIATLRAKFVQLAPSGTETSGTVSLDRPGKLRFDYDAPSDQLIVATGGIVYVHDAALETTDSYPVDKTPLRFLLAEKIVRTDAQLREVFRTEEGVAVILAATDEDVPGELALIFSAPDFDLKEWVVFEPNGAATQVTLSEVDYGARLPARLFRVPESGGAFLRDR